MREDISSAKTVGTIILNLFKKTPRNMSSSQTGEMNMIVKKLPTPVSKDIGKNTIDSTNGILIRKSAR